MPTADTNNNIIVNIYDGIATLGSDYNTSGITANIHLPLSKMVWGNDNVSRRVSSEYPMPVDIKSIGGFSGSPAFGITGTVSGTGTFIVGNTIATPLFVAGIGTGSTAFSPVNVYGNIQGITNGILVGVTGSVDFKNTSVGIYGVSGGTAVAISGTVTVTGERYSNYSTDSINVAGALVLTGVSMGSTAAVVSYTKDSIAVRGPSGESYLSTIVSYLNGSTLTAMGSSGGAINVRLSEVGLSGDALKVALVNPGITFSYTVAGTLGVTNSGGPLKVQGGATSDSPVLVKFYTDTSLNATSIPTRVILEDGSTGSTSFQYQFEAIKTSTDKLSNINDKLSSNTFNVKVVEVTKPRNILSGSITMTTKPTKLTPTTATILKSGINLKAPSTNKSTVYVGSSALVATPSLGYPLEPGESIFLECDNTSSVYCYASIDATLQKIIYIAS